MSSNPYDIKLNKSPSGVVYFFNAQSKKGEIEKAVLMQDLSSAKPPRPGRFNFAMGDVNKERTKISYYKRTGHTDRDTMLSTVNHILHHFMYFHPDAEIVLTGNTAAKKKLYRMLVSSYIIELERDFLVYGATRANGKYELFQPGKSYLVFLITRK